MKIRLKKVFRYQVDARKERELQPGVHDLPEDLALKVLKFGKAEKVFEKVAPENKVVQAPESKKKVARKPVRRSRARSEPDE